MSYYNYLQKSSRIDFYKILYHCKIINSSLFKLNVCDMYKPFILCNKFRYFHIDGLDDAMTWVIRGIIMMRYQWKDECLIFTCINVPNWRLVLKNACITNSTSIWILLDIKKNLFFQIHSLNMNQYQIIKFIDK